VQILRAKHLGGEGALNLSGGGAARQAVIDDNRRVHHAFQRGQGGGSFVKQAGEGVAVGDVAGCGVDLHALAGEGGQRRLCVLAGGAAAADQDQVASAFVDKPLRGTQPEAAQSAGDQVCGVGGQRQT